eukprot:7697384-Pyramimonas_sp.AAC.1
MRTLYSSHTTFGCVRQQGPRLAPRVGVGTPTSQPTCPSKELGKWFLYRWGSSESGRRKKEQLGLWTVRESEAGRSEGDASGA